MLMYYLSGLPGMARRRRRPYTKINSRFQALPVSNSLALGALADLAAITGNLTALTDDFWVQSADLTFAISDLTAGQGPLQFGLNNGDLSPAEIVASVNARPLHRADIINRELARRPVRRVGMISGETDGEAWNDGKTKRISIKMYLAEGVELEHFVINESGAPLTTGAFMTVYGTLYGEWR